MPAGRQEGYDERAPLGALSESASGGAGYGVPCAVPWSVPESHSDILSSLSLSAEWRKVSCRSCRESPVCLTGSSAPPRGSVCDVSSRQGGDRPPRDRGRRRRAYHHLPLTRYLEQISRCHPTIVSQLVIDSWEGAIALDGNQLAACARVSIEGGPAYMAQAGGRRQPKWSAISQNTLEPATQST